MMDITPVMDGVERLLCVPYKEEALEVDVMVSQFDELIRLRDQPAAERKRLKGLRDRLLAHRAAAQMQLFRSDGANETYD